MKRHFFSHPSLCCVPGVEASKFQNEWVVRRIRHESTGAPASLEAGLRTPYLDPCRHLLRSLGTRHRAMTQLGEEVEPHMAVSRVETVSQIASVPGACGTKPSAGVSVSDVMEPSYPRLYPQRNLPPPTHHHLRDIPHPGVEPPVPNALVENHTSRPTAILNDIHSQLYLRSRSGVK